MRLAILLLIVFSFAPVHALFLAGEGEAGKISILCEGQPSVFIVPPGGTAEMLSLDTTHQAEYVPGTPGPYTVQCGNDTKSIMVAPQPAEPAGIAAAREEDLLVFAALSIFSLFTLGAVLFAAKELFWERTEFRKIVGGNSAKLCLRAGRKLEKITIADPVAIGFSGKEMLFSIPMLCAGKEWAWEYEVEEPEKALPASLEAMQNGRQIIILSSLFIEGKESGGSHVAPAAGTKKIREMKTLRRLPKAD